MEIGLLAHRGCWDDRIAKNSKDSFKKAFEYGFGIETDIREGIQNDLIVSHDPNFYVSGKSEISVDWLLEEAKQYNEKSCLALNIKCDGILPLLFEKITRCGIVNYFVFDMSVPDLVSSLRYPINRFYRLSKYEPFSDAIFTLCDGVWVDTYDDSFPSKRDMTDILSTNKKVAIVSPELHSRPHAEFWKNLLSLEIGAKCYLCTDFPSQASQLFS